jgi:hypothetical protein
MCFGYSIILTVIYYPKADHTEGNWIIKGKASLVQAGQPLEGIGGGGYHNF